MPSSFEHIYKFDVFKDRWLVFITALTDLSEKPGGTDQRTFLGSNPQQSYNGPMGKLHQLSPAPSRRCQRRRYTCGQVYYSLTAGLSLSRRD